MNKLAKVDDYIASQDTWKGELLAKLRSIIHGADPEIVEEWKWDVPVFVDKKMVCAISAFKDHVKINFFNGAILNDKSKLFNNGLESKKNRSIDLTQDYKIDEKALIELIREAVVKVKAK